MRKASPDKEFITAPPEGNCACNECPHMKHNTLEKVYLALRDLAPRIEMPTDAARARARADRSDARAEQLRAGFRVKARCPPFPRGLARQTARELIRGPS